MEINIFEYAAKNAIRFNFRGNITTEDLYNLRLDELDAVYKDLNRTRKAQTEESLWPPVRQVPHCLMSKLSWLSMLSLTNSTNAQWRKKLSSARKKKQKLMALMAEKDDADLRALSKGRTCKRPLPNSKK